MNDIIKEIMGQIQAIETDEDVFKVGKSIAKAYVDCKIASSDVKVLDIYLEIAVHNIMKAPATVVINTTLDSKLNPEDVDKVMKDIQKNDINI